MDPLEKQQAHVHPCQLSACATFPDRFAIEAWPRPDTDRCSDDAANTIVQIAGQTLPPFQ